MKYFISIILSLVLLAAAFAQTGPGQDGAVVSPSGADGAQGGSQMTVNARHDRPGPVNVVVEGFDMSGNQVFQENLTLDGDNNEFSDEAVSLPGDVRAVRFVFQNDAFLFTQDQDRNFYLDYFTVGGDRVEGEDFDQTGGTSLFYAGCEEVDLDGQTVVECDASGDWVVYSLSADGQLPAGVGGNGTVGTTDENETNGTDDDGGLFGDDNETDNGTGSVGGAVGGGSRDNGTGPADDVTDDNDTGATNDSDGIISNGTEDDDGLFGEESDDNLSENGTGTTGGRVVGGGVGGNAGTANRSPGTGGTDDNGTVADTTNRTNRTTAGVVGGTRNATSSGAGGTRLFSGDFNGTYEEDDEFNPMLGEFVANNSVDATGEFSQLGDTDVSGMLASDWSGYTSSSRCADVNGTLTLEAANGDEMMVQVEGVQCETDMYGINLLTAGFQMAGNNGTAGTGRFQNAQGMGTLTATLNTFDQTFNGSFDGTNQYDASDRSRARNMGGSSSRVVSTSSGSEVINYTSDSATDDPFGTRNVSSARDRGDVDTTAKGNVRKITYVGATGEEVDDKDDLYKDWTRLNRSSGDDSDDEEDEDEEEVDDNRTDSSSVDWTRNPTQSINSRDGTASTSATGRTVTGTQDEDEDNSSSISRTTTGTRTTTSTMGNTTAANGSTRRTTTTGTGTRTAAGGSSSNVSSGVAGNGSSGTDGGMLGSGSLQGDLTGIFMMENSTYELFGNGDFGSQTGVDIRGSINADGVASGSCGDATGTITLIPDDAPEVDLDVDGEICGTSTSRQFEGTYTRSGTVANGGAAGGDGTVSLSLNVDTDEFTGTLQ